MQHITTIIRFIKSSYHSSVFTSADRDLTSAYIFSMPFMLIISFSLFYSNNYGGFESVFYSLTWFILTYLLLFSPYSLIFIKYYSLFKQNNNLFNEMEDNEKNQLHHQ